VNSAVNVQKKLERKPHLWSRNKMVVEPHAVTRPIALQLDAAGVLVER
jgi:hypothetical protein